MGSGVSDQCTEPQGDVILFRVVYDGGGSGHAPVGRARLWGLDGCRSDGVVYFRGTGIHAGQGDDRIYGLCRGAGLELKVPYDEFRNGGGPFGHDALD